MRAGTLKHIIEIQTPVSTKDETGGTVVVWTKFIDTRAAIWPLSGSERLNMGKMQGEITHKVRIRYMPGITSAMRIVFGGRIFELTTPPINKDERNRMLEILCLEVV